MPAGSIVIDLLMRTGAFETDSKRAEKRLNEMQKSAQLAGAAIGATLVAGVTAAVAAFESLTDSAGAFQDLADESGASAEGLASIAVAAATAGVSMESVNGSIIKLNKNLVGLDDESKATGAALAALGIPLDEFKRLKPEEQIDKLTKAFNSFAGGPEKASVALALYGKAGAEQLKVFKALEDQGGRTNILTAEQIALADEYSDKQSRNVATIKQYAQAIATDFLPALNDVTEVFKDYIAALVKTDSAGRKLTSDTSIKEFADGIATAFGFVVDQVDLVVRLFQIAGTSIAGVAGVAINALSGNFAAAKVFANSAAKDIDEIIARETFGDKLKKQIAARNAALANPASYSNEGRAPTKTKIDFDGADKATKTKQSEFDKYLESLQKGLETTQQLSEAEKLYAEIAAGRLSTLTQEQFLTLDAAAHEIDAQKALTESRKKDNEVLEQMNANVKKNADEAIRLKESVETPLETLNRKLEELNKIAADNPFVDLTTQSRLSAQAWDEYGKAVEKATDKTNDFAKQAAANIQDALGSSVQSVLEGNFSSIEQTWKSMLLKLASQAIAANLGKYLLGGDFGTTGNLGGLLGGLFGTGAKPSGAALGGDVGLAFADGGDPPVGRVSVVGERGPELFVPRSAGTVIPNHMLGGGGGANVTIENHGARVQTKQDPNSNDVKVIVDLVESRIAGGVAKGTGSVSQALQSRGVSLDRGLARRG